MKGNKIKIVTVVLAILCVCMISFVGIYVKETNHMENVVKGYTLGMNLEGGRVITLEVSEGTKEVVKDKDGKVVEDATDEDIKKNGYTEEEVPYNDANSKTIENYEKSKAIIENRLKEFNVTDYIIRQDKTTGKIMIEVPENDMTDNIVSNIKQNGKFEITDSENGNVLIDNDDIKNAQVMYQNQAELRGSGTVVFLQINFNERGKEKLANISKEYVKTTNQDGKETEKRISLKIDDAEMLTTSFDEPLNNGILQLSMGQASTDEETIKETARSASTTAAILTTGALPITYDIINNEFIKSDITNQWIIYFIIVVAVIILISIISMIIKHRLFGLVSGFSYLGYIAIFLLILRYTNVEVTIESLAGMLIAILLNDICIRTILAKIKEYNEDEIEKTSTSNAIKEALKKYIFRIIPVAIISVVFCFIVWKPIGTFGMTIFWGIVLTILYHSIITKFLLELRAKR